MKYSQRQVKLYTSDKNQVKSKLLVICTIKSIKCKANYAVD